MTCSGRGETMTCSGCGEIMTGLESPGSLLRGGVTTRGFRFGFLGFGFPCAGSGRAVPTGGRTSGFSVARVTIGGWARGLYCLDSATDSGGDVLLCQARELASFDGDSSRWLPGAEVGAFIGERCRGDLGSLFTGSVLWPPSFFSNMEMRALVGAMGAVSVRSRLATEPEETLFVRLALVAVTACRACELARARCFGLELPERLAARVAAMKEEEPRSTAMLLLLLLLLLLVLLL